MDAAELAPGHRQVARLGGAHREDDGVVALGQLGTGQLAAHVDAGPEDGALATHLVQTPVEVLLLHLELGDAVAHQPADLVGPLVDGDRVTGPGELLSRRETGRAGADDRDRATGEPLGRLGPHEAGLPRLVDDRDLDVLDGDRVLVDAQHAGRLARRRTEATGELREVVGRVQALDGTLPVVAPDQVVPLRDDVAQRATLVAERDAAVHAPAGLRRDDREQRAADPVGVDLVPVADALLDGAAGRDLAALLQEALRVSHGAPPSSRGRSRCRRARLPRPSPWPPGRSGSHGASPR
ncbi:unannotated protein [freshwater metagenome]|uniref:Unannotated protein n=1 Tax=freshwater metagenome TaxID=449393 RepID=A0A6J6PKK2_9ZZZZ